MKLYSDRFWISPWVFDCFVTLKEKGVDFEVVELALDRRETRTPEYRKLTTTGKVPALDDDGFILTESAAIIEYLEEKFPSVRVLPGDARERARARQVMSFLRTDLYALREERSTNTMFYENTSAPLSEKAQTDVEHLYQVASSVVADGATSMFGDWCLADSALAFCLQRLGMNAHELPARLRPFVAAQWSRPSVAEYVAHPRAAYVPY